MTEALRHVRNTYIEQHNMSTMCIAQLLLLENKISCRLK